MTKNQSTPQALEKEALFNTYYGPLFQQLRSHRSLKRWQASLTSSTLEALNSKHWAALPSWEELQAAMDKLDLDALRPDTFDCSNLNQPFIKSQHRQPLTESSSQTLKEILTQLKPWRKGPYDLYDIEIDTEWRSDLKWDRLAAALPDMQGKTILDVGCGNGYHLWRMIGNGAKLAIGIDPSVRFVLQWQMVRYLLGVEDRAFVLPLGIEQLPSNMDAFDISFSMGVLYHRRSPIDHLLDMRNTLKKGGQLILETLVVDGDINTVLVPEERYAKMPNVWFLPSVEALTHWLKRAKFSNVHVVDVTTTTTAEQRPTAWMDTQSLPDFLDPNDSMKTIEGYPAPKRAVLMATR